MQNPDVVRAEIDRHLREQSEFVQEIGHNLCKIDSLPYDCSVCWHGARCVSEKIHNLIDHLVVSRLCIDQLFEKLEKIVALLDIILL